MKIFSVEKIKLTGKSVYLVNYYKALGDFDITMLLNKGLLTMNKVLLFGVITGGETGKNFEYQG